jgi:hypothetical protein
MSLKLAFAVLITVTFFSCDKKRVFDDYKLLELVAHSGEVSF